MKADLIKTLKHFLKTEPKDLKIQKYTIAQILTNNPTYKQLSQLKEIVSKHNWQINIVDGDRATAFNEGLNKTYFLLINDMMTDIVKGKAGESLDNYTQQYKLY
jgi:hypothetical protein